MVDSTFLEGALALHGTLCYRPAILADCLRRLGASSHDETPREVRHHAERILRTLGAAPDWALADRARRWLESDPARKVLIRGAFGYPETLEAIPDPPPLLFIEGDTSALNAPQVAIVGSRAASAGALEFAAELAQDLAALGLVVTSGLARGIDGAAHRGALRAGQTVAVLGCGPDRVYPPGHTRLAREVVACGAVVSEFPVGASPQAYHFPRRNRLISGLSSGVVVIEAGLASGSLLTARAALDQGREVFAVPGSVRNPLSRGCHVLIREGAHLTEGVADVLQGLPAHALACLRPAGLAGLAAGAGLPALGPEQQKVLEALGFEPTAPAVIAYRAGLTMQTLSSILIELELVGRVRRLLGGTYERIH